MIGQVKGSDWRGETPTRPRASLGQSRLRCGYYPPGAARPLVDDGVDELQGTISHVSSIVFFVDEDTSVCKSLEHLIADLGFRPKNSWRTR